MSRFILFIALMLTTSIAFADKYCINNAATPTLNVFNSHGKLLGSPSPLHYIYVDAEEFPLTITACETPDSSCGSSVLTLTDKHQYTVWGSKLKYWTTDMNCTFSSKKEK